MASDATLELQRTSFVLDALAGGGTVGRRYIKTLIDAGYNAANFTVSGHEDEYHVAVNKVLAWHWFEREHPEMVRIVRGREDLDEADGYAGVRALLGFQGLKPLAHEFHNAEVFFLLGIRIMQLTYNDANELGFGCLEPMDTGLTHFGIQLIRDMNRLGVMVDVTHAGKRTSLDAIEHSSQPVIFSHSNAKAVRDNPRNIDDEQLKALQACGGVVGIAGFADFVADTNLGQPTVAQMIDHVVYVAGLIGIDHVGIGGDTMSKYGDRGTWWNNNTLRRFPEICGAMDEFMHGIVGFEDWSEFPNLTEELLNRGFSEEETAKIIGGNFLRVFKEVLT